MTDFVGGVVEEMYGMYDPKDLDDSIKIYKMNGYRGFNASDPWDSSDLEVINS